MEEIHFLLNALRIAEANEDKVVQGIIHARLGVGYSALEEHDQAIRHLEKYLKFKKEIGDKVGEGAACRIIGNSSISLGQYDKAMKYCEMHLNIAKQIGDKAGEGCAYGNLGNCYIAISQYDRAIKYQEMHLKIAKQVGHKAGEGVAYGNLGRCYMAISQYNKAIKYHEMHLEITKQIGDKAGEGCAYGNLGNCYIATGQYDRAIKYQEMYLKIAKQVGVKAGEGVAYGNLGSCYMAIAQYNKAIKYHEMQLDLTKQIGDKAGEGGAYGNLGNCFTSLGQYEKAMKYHIMCLDIAKQIGDKAGEGGTYGNLGNCFLYLGRYDKAIKYFEMHLNIAKQIGDKAGEGNAYGNLGNCYRYLGQYDNAINYHEKHLGIAKQIREKAGEGGAYGNLGSSYICIGQYVKAIKCHEMYLDIAKQILDKKGEAVACGNLGACFMYLEQYDKAINYQEMYLNIAKQIGDKAGEGCAYGNLGNCYRYLGQYDNAIKYHEWNLDIARQIADKGGEAAAYANLGGTYAFLGQHSDAIEYHELCIKIVKQTGDKKTEASVYSNLAFSYVIMQQYEKAERACRESLQCFEKLFENVGKEDLFKVSFVDVSIVANRLVIIILLLQDKNEEALVIAERGRAKALAKLMFTSHPAKHAEVTKAKQLDLSDILDVGKTMDVTVLFYSILYIEMCTWVIQPIGDVKTICIEDLLQVKKDVLKDDDFASHVNSLIGKAMEQLRSGCVIKSEDRSLSFLYPEDVEKQTKDETRPVALQSTKIPDWPCFQLDRDQASHFTTLQNEEATTRTSSSESATANSDKEAQLNSVLKELYRIVLGPVRQCVEGSQVVVVPDGPLALVPFAALIDENGRYVAESLQVRLVPSLATMKMIIEHPQDLGRAGCPLIIGDPNVRYVIKGEKKIPAPRLPCAKIEAQRVAQLLKVQPFTGRMATKKKFLETFESASLIHIAAHGDSERGEILLAPSPGEDRTLENIMLTISDIEDKRTRAGLVVLSSCHSGRGVVRAEGVIGIARAFLGAGARAVLVSPWALDDEATLLFMNEFYEHLISGERASEALHNAMKNMRVDKKLHHPRYWAPFVLIGGDIAPFSESSHVMVL